MIAAIMQPYFFPYIGYFQLMAAVDTFVFFDDVQYINRGWVNRNRIRVGNRATWLTFPVHKGGRDLPINKRSYMTDGDVAGGIKEQLRSSYSKAGSYDEASDLIHELLDFDGRNVARFNANLLKRVAKVVGIDCEFVSSSLIDKPSGPKGQDKIIDLCKRVGANHYVNAIGGQSLYDSEAFHSNGLELTFLRTSVLPVKLDDGPQFLSIIDTLMHKGFHGCEQLMNEYQKLSPTDLVAGQGD